jgi:hypothetical protein
MATGIQGTGSGGKTACLLGLLSTLACHTQVVEIKSSSGRPGYIVTCADSFARCETKANELCPNGYETMSSEHRSKRDAHLLPFKPDAEFVLEVACEGQGGRSSATSP